MCDMMTNISFTKREKRLSKQLQSGVHVYVVSSPNKIEIA